MTIAAACGGSSVFRVLTTLFLFYFIFYCHYLNCLYVTPTLTKLLYGCEDGAWLRRGVAVGVNANTQWCLRCTICRLILELLQGRTILNGLHSGNKIDCNSCLWNRRI